MSKLLNKKSLYDLPKRNVQGSALKDFTDYGPGQGYWDRDADLGDPTESPFDSKDHLKQLLENKITSTRNGGMYTSYLSDVGGTTHPSSYRPLDFDLERNPLYPNYDTNFGTPGPNSTYQNNFLAVDPQAKF